jgi:lysyl-tRNA synthetase class 1
MEIMLPTLGPDRRATYSPFLPVSPKTGRVLQVPTLERNVARGTIVYAEPDGERVEVPVTGGHAKMQWKPDWALRWAALGVDYEMSGKDLIDSVQQSSRICRALGRTPPEGFTYELFLDENAEKISKSKGNGLSVEEWLRYGSQESLAYFMYGKPRSAKRLYFDVIPRAEDEYHQQLRAYHETNDPAKRLANPVWAIHAGEPPQSDLAVPFSMLLTLAASAAAEDKAVLWGFIRRYAPEASPETHPHLDQAAEHAVRYYQDYVRPARTFRAPTEAERAALGDLRARLDAWEGGADPEELQAIVYAVGRAHGYENLRDWFRTIYEVLLGSEQGPRFGGFIALYGVPETVVLIDRALAGELAA